MNAHHHTTPALTLSNLARWSSATTSMSPAYARRRVRYVSNDSRTVGPGDLFVALRTENDDGHRYVGTALKAGAIGALVSKRFQHDLGARGQRKLLFVNDPLRALQRCASTYRKELGTLIIGITGSNGKTTARELMCRVLSTGWPVGSTLGNWNNHIGVPLSLLRFTGKEMVGVIEMGANHLHEIHTLSRIARPDIAVVTNIGYAHVGLFGSLAGTTEAKFEIADGLNRRKGFLLLNGDDSRLVKGASARKLRSRFYGFSPRCEIRATDLQADDRGTRFRVDGQRFRLSIPGRHFVYAALPAIAMGRRCGLSEERIARTIEEFEPVGMRGTIVKKKGVRFILDCYNANPSSMDNALLLLADATEAKERVAVVGDMLELGKHSTRLHRQLGKHVAKRNVRQLITAGEYASHTARGAREAGMSSGRVHTAADAEGGLQALRRVVRKGDTVLLKASRALRFETIYERF